jgi:hypothetical protein
MKHKPKFTLEEQKRLKLAKHLGWYIEAKYDVEDPDYISYISVRAENWFGKRTWSSGQGLWKNENFEFEKTRTLTSMWKKIVEYEVNYQKPKRYGALMELIDKIEKRYDGSSSQYQKHRKPKVMFHIKRDSVEFEVNALKYSGEDVWTAGYHEVQFASHFEVKTRQEALLQCVYAYIDWHEANFKK